MKEACRIISLCVKQLKNLLEIGALQLLSRENLFKIAGSSNRVIADSSSKCILNIVKNVNSNKIIETVCKQRELKSNFVRVICSQCILHIVESYPKNLILKSNQTISNTIKFLLTDSNGEVRSVIRKAFIIYKKRFPKEAEIIYNLLNRNVKRQINEDEKLYSDKVILLDNDREKKINLSPIKKRIKMIFKSANKPKSNEIKVKLKEINNLKSINININNNNYNIQKDILLNNNIIINKQGLNFSQEKHSRFKSEKRHKFAEKLNLNLAKFDSKKDLLKKLNEKFSKIGFSEKSETLDKSTKENTLPPIRPLLPPINKSQALKKLTIINDGNISENRPINLYEKSLNTNLDKINNCDDMNEKLKIFETIYNEFKEINENCKNFNGDTIKKIMNIHLDNLCINNISLNQQVIKNLIRIIVYLLHLLTDNDIKLIVKIIFTKLNEGEKQIADLSYRLLDKIRQKGKIENIYKGIFSYLESNNSDKNDICYNYLAFLFSHYGNVFYYKKIFKLLGRDTNSDSKIILKLIDSLYKYNPKFFVKLYKEENDINRNKIYKIMMNNNYQIDKVLKEQFEMSAQNIEEKKI